MNKIKVKLIGEDGNIFNLLSIVSRKLKRNDQRDEAEEMRERAFEANSYDEALMIISDYVKII